MQQQQLSFMQFIPGSGHSLMNITVRYPTESTQGTIESLKLLAQPVHGSTIRKNRRLCSVHCLEEVSVITRKLKNLNVSSSSHYDVAHKEPSNIVIREGRSNELSL